jgi:hypothetical protein
VDAGILSVFILREHGSAVHTNGRELEGCSWLDCHRVNALQPRCFISAGPMPHMTACERSQHDLPKEVLYGRIDLLYI